ncbi:hypothetical protein N7461_002249 [Penicillium sp. DV-2018c]|nr:hypothetical protein N7461_002249 [Penicillium sp. DV-2018c]
MPPYYAPTSPEIPRTPHSLAQVMDHKMGVSLSPWYNFPGYDVNNLFYNPLSMPPNYAPTMEDHFPAEGGSSLGGGPQPPSTFHGHPQESREGTPEDQEEENDEAGDDQED